MKDVYRINSPKEMAWGRTKGGGGKLGIFFVTEDDFFFFFSLLDGKKKSAVQLQRWETILFPPLLLA